MKSIKLTVSIPNIITVFRIFLTPLFVIFILKKMFMPGLLVFSIAAISDGLDGLIARYFNQRTTLGGYLDPIADKLLLVSAYVSLAMLNIIPDWLTVVVLSRDILIVLAIVLFSINDITIEMKPSIVSKFTTVAQILTIFICLLDPDIPNIYVIKLSCIWCAAGFTIISGLHYTIKALAITQTAAGNNNKTK